MKRTNSFFSMLAGIIFFIIVSNCKKSTIDVSQFTGEFIFTVIYTTDGAGPTVVDTLKFGGNISLYKPGDYLMDLNSSDSPEAKSDIDSDHRVTVEFAENKIITPVILNNSSFYTEGKQGDYRQEGSFSNPNAVFFSIYIEYGIANRRRYQVSGRRK